MMILFESSRPVARKAAGTPLLIGTDGASSSLVKLTSGDGSFTEAWLQNLAFEHPEVLPVTDIEPGFGKLVPVAREVPCAHGYIDNLYITPAGDIVLVEAKLWRNHQARREVVAQALDYVAALMGMGFEAFEAACRKGQGMTGATLHSLVANWPDAPDEAAFIDAVARNLARGRMLVMVLGDGIRSEAEALAGLLQSHAGAHFTFALVELALWRNPVTGDLVVLPGTLAQTAMITRGVVTIENGAAVISAAPITSAPRPGSISEELYYEKLGMLDPALPGHVRAFIARLEPLGVYPEFLASLNLKVDLPGAVRPVNLGYITKAGKLWTDANSWTGSADTSYAYNDTLANCIGGSVAYFPSGSSYVSTDGKSAPLITALLPRHADAWAQAIERAIAAMRAKDTETGGSFTSDAAIHEAILDHPAAEKAVGEVRTARLLAQGLTPAQIDAAYGEQKN